MNSNPATPLLDTVETPLQLRQLRADQLRQLADELLAGIWGQGWAWSN